ncbi:alpha/beta hydrolase [Lactiplantibacillus garii]|uniref:Alpha/beta hydrolase n=1 Tax=Lactiplantibacillus garii TaxID=2306423 RepID=A0A426D9S7_9LACO|nr:alpha/beta hydrolase [Lactiplantibacillus garii]RRK11306.1 alpha/beta hydrolase [Lactiplantibacillus garii]
MWKKLGWLSVVLVTGLLLTGCRATTPTTKSNASGRVTAVPTLFFHGYGSSINAETHMANAAVKAGVTRSVVQAQVANDGSVRLKGHFKAGERSPIVEVGFANNRNGNYRVAGRWVKNVVVTLQQRYRIKAFNVVGHSMGNMAIVYYLLQYGANKRLPQLRKQVDIAGHFNGILGMNDEPNRMKLKVDGQPMKMDADYRTLLKLRQTLPKNQIQVLNIYGDKNDGTHSDGRVSNASSQSLRYLVAPRAQSYREKRIVGPAAQHSRLHENAQVDRALIKFIWNQ